ncbi:unnamed protein product [Moneuplotes crassus]|uniref:Uncharacterized protein n=1 Tax=Euplotes crassus TaxID=5936 RepID=A0AAD2D1C2_EUPCR|nr:unnamed protein product [Moneuplotes crassus]
MKENILDALISSKVDTRKQGVAKASRFKSRKIRSPNLRLENNKFRIFSPSPKPRDKINVATDIKQTTRQHLQIKNRPRHRNISISSVKKTTWKPKSKIGSGLYFTICTNWCFCHLCLVEPIFRL